MHTLVVRQQENGYFYVGSGRSIAEGPFRRPEHVMAAAADLVPEGAPWAIEVFDKAGNRMMGFASQR